MQNFKKVEVLECFCGSRRFDENAQVIKHYHYGDISFNKCINCHSYIQSPKLTIESLIDWYNSPDYSSAQKDKEFRRSLLRLFCR